MLKHVSPRWFPGSSKPRGPHFWLWQDGSMNYNQVNVQSDPAVKKVLNPEKAIFFSDRWKKVFLFTLFEGGL
jgi:hypothetical protein